MAICSKSTPPELAERIERYDENTPTQKSSCRSQAWLRIWARLTAMIQTFNIQHCSSLAVTDGWILLDLEVIARGSLEGTEEMLLRFQTCK